MKRKTLVVKHLIFALVVFAATMAARADIPRPMRYAMSRAEWVAFQNSLLLWAIPGVFLMVLFGVLVMSVRRKRPSYLVCFSCCITVILVFAPHPFTGNDLQKFVVFSALCFSAVSWLLASVVFFSKRKVLNGLFALLLIPSVLFGWLWLSNGDFTVMCFAGGNYPVEPKVEETYEEYIKRANKIIYHRCDKCDKLMKEYWRECLRCPDCDKEEMTCLECGAQKKQIYYARHYGDPSEWMCPDCEKSEMTCLKCGMGKEVRGYRWECPNCAKASAIWIGH